MLIPILEPLALVALVVLPIWFWLDLTSAALFAVLVLLVYVGILQWRVHRFERWLVQPNLDTPMVRHGVWLEIAFRIQRMLKQREKQTHSAEQRLDYFLKAIQASPNGVVLLDSEGRIEWCNATASSHLGLDNRQDFKQHIVHLVRDPLFSKYFALDIHDSEVVIEGRSNTLSQVPKLSVQMHAYGNGQHLLLTRDITSVTLADAMRRDFVANVSHEIRTPLTVLSGFVETLQSIPLQAEEQQRYLHMMGLQAERMQSLVADLLTLSQLEGSVLPALYEKVALPELMGRVAADATALSAVLSEQEGENRGPVHDLVFEPAPLWAVACIRSELFSAISNLVSNAIRYTPAGGRVCAGWSQQADGVVFSVTDTGPGIAPEHVPRLSERFYRVDRSRSRETGGTGLGLAIAKHVVQRLGGELRIESQLGKGSTFMLLLPASRIEPLQD